MRGYSNFSFESHLLQALQWTTREIKMVKFMHTMFHMYMKSMPLHHIQLCQCIYQKGNYITSANTF